MQGVAKEPARGDGGKTGLKLVEKSSVDKKYITHVPRIDNLCFSSCLGGHLS